MSSQSRKLVLLTGLVVILVVMFSFVMKNASHSEYNVNVDHIRELQTLERQWSIEAIKTQFIVDSDFDMANAYLTKVRLIQQKLLGSELTSPDMDEEITNQLYAFLSNVEVKEEAIERFKSNLAIVRNSLKYFPIALDLVLERANLTSDKELEYKAKTIDRDLQSYFASPDITVKDRMLSVMDTMSELDTDGSNFISHTKVLLDKKAPTDQLLKLISGNQVTFEGNSLLNTYGQYDMNRRSGASLYNLVPYIGAIILFLLLMFGTTSSNYQPVGSQRIQPDTSKILRDLDSMDDDDLDVKSDNDSNNSTSEFESQQEVVSDFEQDPVAEIDAMSKSESGDISGGISADTDDSLVELVSVFAPLREKYSTIAVPPDIYKDDTARYGGKMNIESFESLFPDMSGSIQQVAENYDFDSLRENTDFAALSGKSVDALIDNLNVLSNDDWPNMTGFDLNTCVNEVIEYYQQNIDSNVFVGKELSFTGQFIGMQSDIKLLMRNIILNAIQSLPSAELAVGQSRKILIQLKEIREHASIVVLNSSLGTSPFDQDKIFSPFYTTRASSDSLGLGLTASLKIAIEHEGSITCRKISGKGTAFQILLPIKQA